MGAIFRGAGAWLVGVWRAGLMGHGGLVFAGAREVRYCHDDLLLFIPASR